VNTNKNKYMLMSRKKAGQKQIIKIENRSFQDVAKVQIFWNNTKSENLLREEIKSRVSPRNACYHSVQSLLSSRLLSWNLKVKYKKP
jgi:hypothetical protein